MAKQSLLVFGLDDQLYLGRFGLNVQLRDDELDGAALQEHREEHHGQGSRHKQLPVPHVLPNNNNGYNNKQIINTTLSSVSDILNLSNAKAYLFKL